MATYDERIKGVKDISFKEAVANIKDELQSRLIRIYFRDEPDFVDLIKDDVVYAKIFDAYLESDELRDAFELHCRRRYVVRYCGTLFKYSTSYPPRIANRVALELGVQHVSYHLKRSGEYDLSRLQKLKFYNKALRMEMMMLQEDLDWNDDLNDDMFNEILRFERGVERERVENEHLTLKGKARRSEIELLTSRLYNEFGIRLPKKEKKKRRRYITRCTVKTTQVIQESQETKEHHKHETLAEEKTSRKSEQKRGFTMAS